MISNFFEKFYYWVLNFFNLIESYIDSFVSNNLIAIKGFVLFIVLFVGIVLFFIVLVSIIYDLIDDFFIKRFKE